MKRSLLLDDLFSHDKVLVRVARGLGEPSHIEEVRDARLACKNTCLKDVVAMTTCQSMSAMGR